MDDTDELIALLSSTVEELKRGIIEYNSALNSPSPQVRQMASDYVREMHQIALKLSQGVSGLQQLKVLKSRLSSGR